VIDHLDTRIDLVTRPQLAAVAAHVLVDERPSLPVALPSALDERMSDCGDRRRGRDLRLRT
jgi:hypothetical protein